MRGIGRTIARWLVSRGASWLLILSRSGNNSVAARDLVKDLENSGAYVATPACDIGDRIEVQRVLARSTKYMPPIRGCTQASMVLQVREPLSWLASLLVRTENLLG